MRRLTDAAVGVLMGAAAALYLSAWPNNLGTSDEAYYLFHAKRLLAGEVLYRDMFDFITPLFTDLMAVLFRLFGAGMTTARTFNAVVHGGIVLVVYLTCRAAGVRTGLAATAAVAHLALGQPAWQYASPHWTSTLVTGLLLWASLDRRWARQRGGLVVQGLLLGVLLALQQQKGVVMGAALTALLLADVAFDRRGGGPPGPPLARSLFILAAGALTVVGPLMAFHLASAGLEPIVHQLVLHPFTGYGRLNRSAWGAVNVLTTPMAAYVWPQVLTYLPLVIPVDLLRVVTGWVARGDRQRIERPLVLAVFASASAASILYFPDFIHVAFIAPVFFVCIAEALEAGLARLDRTGTVLGRAIAVALLVCFGWRLRDNLARARAEFPIARETAFGRVDFASERDAALIERVRGLVEGAGSREIFCYPAGAAVYLMTDTDNPTPHEIILPVYQSDEEIERTIATLEARRVPVVVLYKVLVGRDDPVGEYVRTHYACDEDGLCVRNP